MHMHVCVTLDGTGQFKCEEIAICKHESLCVCVHMFVGVLLSTCILLACLVVNCVWMCT